MHRALTMIRGFFHGPGFRGNAGRTFRYHLMYGVFDGTAGGILLNAPLVAIKTFDAANWHLPLRELYAGLGMMLTLYLASQMARRSKMPFVFFPGMLAAVSAMALALVTGSAFWFLTLLGVGAMFEIFTRPAIAAIVRTNYPVEKRCCAVGQIRKWSSLAFLTSSVMSAYVLHRATGGGLDPAATAPASAYSHFGLAPVPTAQLLMLTGGLLSLVAFLCFRQIRVDEAPSEDCAAPTLGFIGSFRALWDVISHRNGRFRRYLLGCFVDGFFQMLYFSLIWVFLSRDLGYGYVRCVALMHVVPAFAAFVATGALGRLFDRINPWISWAGVRFAWGADALLLAATPTVASVFPPALFFLPVVARLLRGSVQGGWWILWWQVGVTYFAPPGEETSRYAGLMVFLNGTTRLLASATGMALVAASVSPRMLLVVGGVGVILSGVYSLWQAGWELQQRGPQTIVDFEYQFGTQRET